MGKRCICGQPVCAAECRADNRAPVQKTLPEKPGYLFRLTLGLHPDIGDARTVTLDLPAAEAELLDAQAQLGTEGWEGVAVIDYDGIIPMRQNSPTCPWNWTN